MASSGKLGVLIDCILIEINKTKLTTFDLKRNDTLQNNLVHFFEIFGWKFWHPENSRDKGKLNCSDHQIVTSYIDMVNVVPLLFIW